MVTRAYGAVTSLNQRANAGQWTGLLNGDDGAPVDLNDYTDRSVQVQGTIGVGGNCRIEGSNDGTNYVVLTDPQGTALNITAAGVIEQVLEVTRYIRPRITAGDGTTSLTVTIFGVRR